MPPAWRKDAAPVCAQEGEKQYDRGEEKNADDPLTPQAVRGIRGAGLA